MTRWPVFVALGLLETATMYLVGTFCITRLRMLTPGREAAADAEPSEQTGQASEIADKGTLVIAGLGGKRECLRSGKLFYPSAGRCARPRPHPAVAVERERREQRC